jgi:hypothetical protein
MLLKKQRNELFTIIQSVDLAPTIFEIISGDNFYDLELYDEELGEDYFFRIKEKSSGRYDIDMRPGVSSHKFSATTENWSSATYFFEKWVNVLKPELDAPDLWAEAAKTAQLFAPTSTPTDDKFTRIELAEVQGQLRLLQQSFATAALPEAARQKLIELTQTAAVKAEGLTKKDWQNWIIGGFISAIASCALNPTQAAEVLKLVKAAFGGLFLH